MNTSKTPSSNINKINIENQIISTTQYDEEAKIIDLPKLQKQAVEDIRKLYLKYYISPSNTFISQLKTEELKLHLNNYSFSDIQIINKILAKYFYFGYIELAPYDPTKIDPNKRVTRSKYNPLSAGEKDKAKKEKHDKQLEQKQMVQKIINGVSKHLCLTDTLIKFSIYNLDLNPELAVILSQAITDNKTLRCLIINRCNLDIKTYEILVKGLLTHEKIEYVDLSENNFGDKYGDMLARIISRQTQRRDQVIWAYGLRNEKPLTNDYALGLISLDLSGNKLGSKSAEVISNALSYDQYVRSIVLQNNNFDNESCKKFIRMMRKNATLLNVNLRDNPGYDENVNIRIVMKMSKNIRILYQMLQRGEYTIKEFEDYKEFIDTSFFEVDVPAHIIEYYNNMVMQYGMEDGEYIEGQEQAEQGVIVEKGEEQGEKQASEDNKNLQEIKDEEEEEEEEGVIKNSNNNNNPQSSGNKTNKSKNNENNNHANDDVNEENKKLREENLLLKKQIIELKALALKEHFEENPEEHMDDGEGLEEMEDAEEEYMDNNDDHLNLTS